MTKRLYFLVPDVAICRVVVRELLERGVKQRHIHVIGNRFTSLEDLPRATLRQTSEFSRGLELGLGLGGAAGLLGGLIAVTFPPAGLVLGGGALLAAIAAGAGGAALVSALVAADIPNRELKAFENAISAGQLLLLVDVPRADVDATVGLIRQHHPDVEVGITEPRAQPPEAPEPPR
jgi:hypothetical protein